jgi:hypothetical protein
MNEPFKYAAIMILLSIGEITGVLIVAVSIIYMTT